MNNKELTHGATAKRAASNSPALAQGWRLPGLTLRACVVGALLGLSSCSTMLRDGSTGPAQQTSTVTTRSGGVTRTSTETVIPVLPGADNSAQQALIDEINRDGQAVQFPGTRDGAPVPVATEGDDTVELNYEQADLRLVLEELADALDISIVIDPSIDSVVSLRTATDRPLNREDIWPLIRLLTRDAGVVINQVGEVYNARSVTDSLPPELVTQETLQDSNGARVMQITPLRFVSPEAAIEIIQPLIEGEGGTVQQITTNNTLAITAGESVLVRINQLLLLIDADPFQNQGIRLFQLSNASATEVAEELAEILLLIEGENPAYQVRGIERINALLVTAPASRGFDEISRWVRILDAASQEQVEQLFMYRVKNLAALELAETLSSVFEEEDSPLAPGSDDEGDDNPSIFDPGADTTDDGSNDNADTVAEPAAAGDAVSADLSVKIVADEATNSLLIRSTARDYRQLLTTINQLDSVPLQVMVNAVIAQITLTDDTRFGVDWSRVAENASLSPLSTTTTTAFAPSLDGLMFTKSFLDGSARVDATLEAIAVNNEVRLLARPSLTVINNQEGEIQIGAQVPVEAGQTIGTAGISTTNIQYRDTGIELYITPQINEDGVVNLIIRQVLSSVDGSAAGVNNNPVFNNQEISTTVVVRNGENVVLGGLIQSDQEALNTGVPFVNRVPVLGNLFSYQQRNLERRELFIVLRPEIIDLNATGGVQYSDILQRFELASEVFEAAGI